MRKVVALLLPVMLFLSACSGASSGADAGDVDALKSVTVKEAADGAAPEITFDTPLTAAEPTLKKLSDGDGEPVKAGMTVDVNLVALNPQDGSVLAETYSSDTEPLSVDDALKTNNAELYNALVGARIGSQIGYFVPASAQGTGAEDQFLVFRLSGARVVPTRAEGEKVEPAAGLPAVTLDEATGEPTIAKPEGAAPTELVVQDLIKGAGAEVKSGDSITVQYTGIKYSDGTVFDSSWTNGAPISFPIGSGGVISGWDKGLVGKTVGSQVLLVIPPAEGYGASEGHELQKETLVFVVDILDTSSAS